MSDLAAIHAGRRRWPPSASVFRFHALFARGLLGWLLAFAVAGAAPGGSAAAAEPLEQKLARLVQRGGVAVGPGKEQGKDGKKTFVYGEGRYVPASIIKLATALAAFHYLGPDFRFRTEVYLDPSRNLILRGYGDPFLVSEEWARIGAELAARGVFDRPLGNLILDESAFAPAQVVDGAGVSLNPYDAGLGALVSNFNTLFVAVDKSGAIRGAEPQTPLTPLARARAAALQPGIHRINFSQKDGDSLRYTGELARALFERAGARFTGRIRAGLAPGGLAPSLVHRSSSPLSERVREMLRFSNNFIANQIVLAIGLEKTGEPAALEKGMALVRGYLRGELGLAGEAFSLVEGSGLSTKNRITLPAMLRIVEAFRPHRALLRPYGGAGRRGRAKTGTLTGVYALAGFLPGERGGGRPFAIVLNQPRNTRGAIYRLIARRFGSPARKGPR